MVISPLDGIKHKFTLVYHEQPEKKSNLKFSPNMNKTTLFDIECRLFVFCAQTYFRALSSLFNENNY